MTFEQRKPLLTSQFCSGFVQKWWFLQGMPPAVWKHPLVYCSMILMLSYLLICQTYCPDSCWPGPCEAFWQVFSPGSSCLSGSPPDTFCSFHIFISTAYVSVLMFEEKKGFPTSNAKMFQMVTDKLV